MPGSLDVGVSSSSSLYMPLVNVNSCDTFFAGKVGLALEYWEQLTSDRYVLDIVRGNALSFDVTPVQDSIPRELRLNDRDQLALDEAIQDFLVCGIVELCVPGVKDCFYSNVFPCIKSVGPARVILNLSEFNLFVEHVHFKMDSLRDALDLVFPGCYFAKVDLKHAYYSVPIRPEDRDWLRFRWHGLDLRFTCLPQGYTASPRYFTKLLVPVFALFRKLGLLTICYIDDALFIASSFSELQEQVAFAMEFLVLLGFTINRQKSEVVPVQEIEFLGFLLNSSSMSVMVTSKKQAKIKSLGRQLLGKRGLSVRELASFIGNVVAAGPGVPLAPLHYRYLEIVRIQALALGRGDYDSVVSLDSRACESIRWWLGYEFPPKSLLPSPVDVFMFTDASSTGWGATIGSLSTGGHWSESELEQINVLELKAVLLGLGALCRDMRQVHVEVHCDNSTAVACINRCGSTRPRLLALTVDIYDWCVSRDIVLSATHVRGVDNVVADRLSRGRVWNTEWSLKEEVFVEVCGIFSLPKVDLFASRINRKLPCFVSWKPDPEAIAFNAFSFSWSPDVLYYAFPPFCILIRVLRKLIDDRATVLLIAPLWPSRPFFSRLLQLCVALPRILPKGALYMPQDPKLRHPLTSLRLGAFLVSGDSSRVESFRKTLPDSCWVHGGLGCKLNMGTISGSGCYFVTRNRSIQCLHL